MLKTSLKSTKAITLIELLIIVAIIGIVSSMSVFSYNRSRAHARFLNTVNDFAETIRTARSLAINSYRINGTEVAEYFQVELKNDGDKIKADITSVAVDSNLDQYDFNSTNGYKITTSGLPVKIKFKPPFGDVEMTDNTNAEIYKLELKIKDNPVSTYCRQLEINKISGILTVVQCP